MRWRCYMGDYHQAFETMTDISTETCYELIWAIKITSGNANGNAWRRKHYGALEK